ncbi:S8 family serine peptidase [Chloroflexia bacterium SDU3-3]|nr:S8 family serine peptidase [Chloroflexia bacterium SDU3-3]
MHLRRYRLYAAAAVLAFCAGWLAPASARAAALSVTPAAVSLSVPLGQTTQTSITFTNTSGEPLALALREAQATGPARARAGEARAQIPSVEGRIDPALLRATRAAPQQQRDFIIYMGDQADLAEAYGIADWKERGEFVYRTLVDHAARSQAGLLAQLRERGLGYRSFWVVNAVLAHGSAADVQAVSQRADVALVRANHTAALPDEQATPAADDPCSPDDPGNPLCWNVRQLRASSVWSDFGVDGAGVVVANIDTGVDVTHPALKASYRGTQGDGSLVNDYNWFDPQGYDLQPRDAGTHGTHTMGTMVGAAVAGQAAVGVAPGARWVAAQGCVGFVCNDSYLLQSAQWLLAPSKLDLSQPRPDLRPMIINNSWSGTPNDQWFAPYVAAWRVAGMFPVFSAGNASALVKQDCKTLNSPGDYPSVVAVGAVDVAGQIADFSLFGPAWDGRVKPDFVGPGAKVYSTVPVEDGSYRLMSGTSMSTPAVAGVVALIWSANPALIGDYEATYDILRSSAVATSDTRCGDAAGGPNSVYGYGRVDAYAAVAQARVDVPWLSVDAPPASLAAGKSVALVAHVDAANVPGPGSYSARVQIYGGDLTTPLASVPVSIQVQAGAGAVTIQGQVRHATSGQPLAASVQAARPGAAGASVATDASGRFQLTLASGQPYDLIASAPSFLTARQTSTYTSSATIGIALAPDQPNLAAATDPISLTVGFGASAEGQIPIANTGTRPLYYEVVVPSSDFAVATSDDAGGPSFDWVDLPADAPTLPAGHSQIVDDIPMGIKFPFYGYVLTDTVLTSDGMVAFDRPISYGGAVTSCLPDPWLNFYTIAGLRMDYDTSQGGRVRYGTVGDRFVVSYENMPLYGSAGGPTYTFQMVLHQDGRVLFQYGQLGASLARASAGIQRSPSDVLSLGCGPTLAIHSNMAVELRPQPNAALWLASVVQAGVLQPGEQATLPIQAAWVRPSSAQALYHSAVEIRSSDPMKPVVSVPVALAPGAAPHELLLPLVARR